MPDLGKRDIGISIHALLAESDCRHNSLPPFAILFLSTLSLRRATVRGSQARAPNGDFYPRSPCGERPGAKRQDPGQVLISIHALLAESDLAGPSGPAISFNFYLRSPCGERLCQTISPSIILLFLSTLSLRRATLEQSSSYSAYLISIHALLAESDFITA